MDDDKIIRKIMCDEVLEEIVLIIEKDLRPMKILDKVKL